MREEKNESKEGVARFAAVARLVAISVASAREEMVGIEKKF